MDTIAKQMGVFCFPAGATMPLHDHPGMVVLTKVLYGSVSWNAYDWVSNPRKSEHLLLSSTPLIPSLLRSENIS